MKYTKFTSADKKAYYKRMEEITQEFNANGKMTVLLVTDNFYPVVDGVLSVVDNYARRLSGRVNVMVCAPVHRWNVPDVPYPVLYCDSMYIHPIRYDYSRASQDRKFRELLNKLRVDVIHIHSPYFTGRYMVDFANKNNIPVISTFHTQYRQDLKRVFKTDTITDTVLDVLFVFGFDWGVTGSGVATLIAQWFMGLFLVVPALLWARADGADWRPRLRGILGSASDGSVLFIRSLALRACMVATVMAATSMGTQVLAAYQSVNSCWNFVINILDAIGIAGQALVAAELGAGHRDRARLMTRAAGRSGLIGGVAIGMALIAVGFVAAPLFSPTPDVQRLITVGMMVLGIFLPLGGWMWAVDGILIGAGDYRYLAAGCAATAVVYLPALWGLHLADGVFLTNDAVRMAVLWTVINLLFIGARAIFNGLRIRTDRWMR